MPEDTNTPQPLPWLSELQVAQDNLADAETALRLRDEEAASRRTIEEQAAAFEYAAASMREQADALEAEALAAGTKGSALRRKLRDMVPLPSTLGLKSTIRALQLKVFRLEHPASPPEPDPSSALLTERDTMDPFPSEEPNATQED